MKLLGRGPVLAEVRERVGNETSLITPSMAVKDIKVGDAILWQGTYYKVERIAHGPAYDADADGSTYVCIVNLHLEGDYELRTWSDSFFNCVRAPRR